MGTKLLMTVTTSCNTGVRPEELRRHLPLSTPSRAPLPSHRYGVHCDRRLAPSLGDVRLHDCCLTAVRVAAQLARSQARHLTIGPRIASMKWRRGCVPARPTFGSSSLASRRPPRDPPRDPGVPLRGAVRPETFPFASRASIIAPRVLWWWWRSCGAMLDARAVHVQGQEGRDAAP